MKMQKINKTKKQNLSIYIYIFKTRTTVLVVNKTNKVGHNLLQGVLSAQITFNFIDYLVMLSFSRIFSTLLTYSIKSLSLLMSFPSRKSLYDGHHII